MATPTAPTPIGVVTLPAEFPVTMLCAAIICGECFVVGMISGMSRFKLFTKEFMEQFQEEHKKHYPEGAAAVGGHPDAGDGRYSDKLEYKDWYEFNCRMRTHGNFVEMLPLILFTLVLGGLFVPKVTMWVAIINTVARIIYTYMYMTKGADSRVIGAVAGQLPIYIVLIWAIVVLCTMAF